MSGSPLARWLEVLAPAAPPQPLLISLDVSDRCNLRCAMCRAWRRPAAADDGMSLATFRALLGGLRGLEGRELVLIGAEPTLNPALADMVAEATAQGFATRLFSNGGQLGQGLAGELAQAGLGRATISVDGAAPSHDHLRGVAGSHARALAAIRSLSAGHGGCRITVGTNTLVTAATFRELPDLVPLVRAAGATRHSFQIPSQVPGALCDEGRSSDQYRHAAGAGLLFEPNQVKGARSTLAALARASRSPSAAILAALPDEAFLEARFPVARCRFTGLGLNLDSAGNAYPCSHFHGVSLGSVAGLGWEAVWSGQERRAFRAGLATGLHEVCRYCCHYVHNLSALRLARAALAARLPA